MHYPVDCSSSSRESKEYRERTIQSHRILVAEFSDALAQPRFSHHGDFFDHESRSTFHYNDQLNPRPRLY